MNSSVLIIVPVTELCDCITFAFALRILLPTKYLQNCQGIKFYKVSTSKYSNCQHVLCIPESEAETSKPAKVAPGIEVNVPAQEIVSAAPVVHQQPKFSMYYKLTTSANHHKFMLCYFFKYVLYIYLNICSLCSSWRTIKESEWGALCI